MQLSLFADMPELNKSYFIDVFAEALMVPGTHKMRLKTIYGQQVPKDFTIRIPNKFIANFPEGTIYKLDTKLVKTAGRKPYFVALNSNTVSRAIEFFDYNLKVQCGFDMKLLYQKKNSSKKVSRLKS